MVTTALNLPGPAACARLRDLGAAVVKVEPPAGDPFEAYAPAWYRRLHADVEVVRLDLKGDAGQAAFHERLGGADLLVTAQRPAALARLGLGFAALSARHPRLCHVAITGYPPPDDGVAGHDLTYMAENGLLSPPAMPASLFADMAGAERAVSTALALVIARDRTGRGVAAPAPLSEAARALAAPRLEGLTAPNTMLTGSLPGYNLYAAREGWIAVAALEPHFERALAQALGLERLERKVLEHRFRERSAAEWQAWARERDLPLACVMNPLGSDPN